MLQTKNKTFTTQFAVKVLLHTFLYAYCPAFRRDDEQYSAQKGRQLLPFGVGYQNNCALSSVL